MDKEKKIRNITSDVVSAFEKAEKKPKDPTARKPVAKKSAVKKPTSRNLEQQDSDTGHTSQGAAANTRPNRGAKPQNVGQRTVKKSRRKKRKKGPLLVVLLLSVLTIGGAGFGIWIFGAGARNNDRGLEAYAAGNYQEAESYFQAAVDGVGKQSTYYQNLAVAQLELAQYDKAHASVTEGLNDTTDQETIQGLYRSQGIIYLQQGQYDNALKSFALTLANTNGGYNEVQTDTLYYQAEAYEKMDNYQGAVSAYTEIINQTQDAQAYLQRGLNYSYLGDYANTEADLLRAIENSKKSYLAYLTLYDAQIAQEKTTEAEETLTNALTLGGDSGEDLAYQGMIYLHMGDNSKAAAVLQQSLDKGYAGANLGFGILFMAQELYGDAKTSIEAYFAAGEGDGNAYNQYGLCLLKLEDYTGAIAAFQQGMTYNEGSTMQALLFNEITAYEYSAQWQTAYEKAQAYVSRYPDDAKGVKELTFLESRQ